MTALRASFLTSTGVSGEDSAFERDSRTEEETEKSFAARAMSSASERSEMTGCESPRRTRLMDVGE